MEDGEEVKDVEEVGDKDSGAAESCLARKLASFGMSLVATIHHGEDRANGLWARIFLGSSIPKRLTKEKDPQGSGKRDLHRGSFSVAAPRLELDNLGRRKSSAASRNPRFRECSGLHIRPASPSRNCLMGVGRRRPNEYLGYPDASNFPCRIAAVPRRGFRSDGIVIFISWAQMFTRFPTFPARMPVF